MLGATAASYDVFKDFNKHVLQKAVKEINDITDITVTTENVRKGRSVESIRFNVFEKATHIIKDDVSTCEEFEDQPPDMNQLFLDQVFSSDYIDVGDPNDPLALCAEALPSNFTREQVELLRLLALEHMPFTIGTLADKEMWLYEYLQKKTKLMEATPGVQSPFAWLRKAVSEDWN